MKKVLTIGFVRSEKAFEKRIAVLPCDLKKVKYKDQLYFETGYGKDLFIEDKEYGALGCHIVSKEEALKQDIICDTKIGEASYLSKLDKGKILFGWIHAAADKQLTETLIEKEFTCYAWEDLYDNQRHIFWENNRLAGYGGVLNAIQYTGLLPEGCQAGIIGRGDTAMGAYQALSNLGAKVQVFNRKQEALFKKEMKNFDIIVMAVRWDTMRRDFLISAQDCRCIKEGAIIIDVSDDVNGAIENSKSSTIQDAVYYREGVMMYSVCNVPSIFFRNATTGISNAIYRYFDDLMSQKDNAVLQKSIIIQRGEIIDTHISEFQQR